MPEVVFLVSLPDITRQYNTAIDEYRLWGIVQIDIQIEIVLFVQIRSQKKSPEGG